MASEFIPEMTEVAWALKGKPLEERATNVHHRSLFHLRRANIDAKWELTRRRPGPGDKLTALVIRILPKFGPLDAFQFHVPTDTTEQLLADSLKATITMYEARIGQLRTRPTLILTPGGRRDRVSIAIVTRPLPSYLATWSRSTLPRSRRVFAMIC